MRVVAAAPADRFEHERWVSACQRKLCAAAWCGYDPWFQERGFITFDGGDRGGTRGSFGIIYMTQGGENYYSYEAIQKFFDLPKYGPANPHALFGPDAYEDETGKKFPGAKQQEIFLAMTREVVNDYEAAAQKGLEDIL